MTYTITSVTPDPQSCTAAVVVAYEDGNTLTYTVHNTAELYSQIDAYVQFQSDLEKLQALVQVPVDLAQRVL